MAGVEVAGRVPAAMSETVRVAVQQVFMDGLHNAVWAAVAITAAAGVTAAFLLRGTVAGRHAVPRPQEAGDTSQVEREVPAGTA